MSRLVRAAGAAVLSVSLLSCLTGCGKKAGQSSGNPANAPRAAKQAPGVSDVLAAGMAEADRKSAGSEEPAAPEPERAGEEELVAQQAAAQEPPAVKTTQEPPAVKTTEASSPVGKSGSSDGIDVDLTALSATMVYSEVFNMMVSPEKYRGKTIKMAGQFYSSYDEIRDRRYYACLIMDATACCAQGMEFVLDGNYTYPNDYPAEGGPVCVTGVFDSYEEDGCAYATLRNARMAFVPGASSAN